MSFPLRFNEQLRYIKEIDVSDKLVIEELNSMRVEEEFDEAAVPEWQCIQTYDRKDLKMKKHKRQKRKKKMRIKLKWSGKL